MTENQSEQNQSAQPRPCPICGEAMEPRIVEFNHVDVCEDHGIWLDKGELESIFARMRRSHRRKGRAIAHEARKEGRINWWLFGPLSFLLNMPKRTIKRTDKKTKDIKRKSDGSR